MEKLGCFKFNVYKIQKMYDWHYQIFDENNALVRESKEVFLYEGIARFAAIGHITLLEQEKG